MPRHILLLATCAVFAIVTGFPHEHPVQPYPPQKLLILAWVMIAGAVLVAAGVTAYYQIENAAGRRVWAGVKQLAASRGEPLSLAQTLPASVQPTENFGATLVFASSFGRQAGGTLDKINGRRPDADAAKWRMTAPPPPPPPPLPHLRNVRTRLRPLVAGRGGAAG
ncbi:hypothetical protein Ga0100231_015410 [Opitutaceae bacterium TAV4]|nr:hypothetical protein Ga0100231_015410 [Opitutaceae bacterium TAV4]